MSIVAKDWNPAILEAIVVEGGAPATAETLADLGQRIAEKDTDYWRIKVPKVLVRTAVAEKKEKRKKGP